MMIHHPELEFQKTLGQGAYGVVELYKQQGYNFPIAIKSLLSPDHAIAKARFRQEIKIARRLKHFPLTVNVFWDQVFGNTPCYAMQYYPEGSLRDRLGEFLLKDKREVSKLIKKLAYALHTTHFHKIIHRDLKPENILFENNEPRIADWGIAKPYLERGNTLTAGTSIGTPVYSAPEQLEGRGSDHRSDIYSLGIIYQELLTGDRQGIVLDRGLRKIIEKMTARSSGKRHQSMEEVIDDIDLLLFKQKARRIGSDILTGFGIVLGVGAAAYGANELAKYWEIE